MFDNNGNSRNYSEPICPNMYVLISSVVDRDLWDRDGDLFLHCSAMVCNAIVKDICTPSPINKSVHYSVRTKTLDLCKSEKFFNFGVLFWVKIVYTNETHFVCQSISIFFIVLVIYNFGYSWLVIDIFGGCFIVLGSFVACHLWG